MSQRELSQEEAKEFVSERRSYAWGYLLSLLLTLVPFGFAAFGDLSRMALWLTIAGCALVQIVVHLRFFLHITWSGNKREDLQLILFTVLILLIMGGGTLWILFSLYYRMMPGMMP